MTNPRPIAIDFFAGAGGLSLGLEQAGFDVALAIDRDGYHVAAHKRNFPYGKALCTSVEDLTGSQIRDLIGTDRDIDLVAGGPPCQGFSHMGTRDANDPRNSLVDEYVRLVVELKPKTFLMENVPGMQSGRTRTLFDRAIRRLRRAGYLITSPVRTLNAADFGVPQKRERLFILGIREAFGREVDYPNGLGKKRITVREALRDLPQLSDHPELLEQDATPYARFAKDISEYARILRGLTRDSTDVSYPRKWDQAVCTCSQFVRHRPEVAALYAATEPGRMVPGHKLPKLALDGLAPTLRAGSESEHGSYTAPRPVHPVEPRCITAREAARLHGYPDWFRFYPGKWHAYRQIGNSVCPPVAFALGEALLQALSIQPRRPRRQVVLDDKFELPDDRPRQHRRITQVDEWPQILEYLVRRALHPKSGRLVKPEILVADIEAAYAATGAKMPRNPARLFISDIARSRNVHQLMKPITDASLSIVESKKDGVCGEFVKRGTEGAIDEQVSLRVSSPEITGATKVARLPGARFEAPSLALYLERGVVSDAFFKGKKVIVTGGRNLLGDLSGGELSFRVTTNGRCTRRGTVIVTRKGNLPTISQVGSALNEAAQKTGIVIAPITQRHFAVFLTAVSGGRLVERKRQVFEVTQPG